MMFRVGGILCTCYRRERSYLHFSIFLMWYDIWGPCLLCWAPGCSIPLGVYLSCSWISRLGRRFYSAFFYIACFKCTFFCSFSCSAFLHIIQG